jgi:hypothetical protein
VKLAQYPLLAMSDESLITDARTKLIWGDAPEQVYHYLQTEGVNEQRAWVIIQSILDERNAEIRAEGKAKILSGLRIGTPSVIVWFVFICLWNLYWDASHLMMASIFLRVAILAMIFIIFALWRIGTGASMLLRPKSKKGDLAKILNKFP